MGLPLPFMATSSVGSAEGSALIARMSPAPSGARQGLIESAIAALKASGLWAKVHAIYFPAAHSQQAARLNWKQAVNDLVEVNAPGFAIDGGFTGNGSSSYLTTNFNLAVGLLAIAQQNNPGMPIGQARQVALQNSHVAQWTGSTDTSTSVDFGAASLNLVAKDLGGVNGSGRSTSLNQLAVPLVGTPGIGSLIVTRNNDASNVRGCSNGGPVATAALATTPLPDATILMGANGSIGGTPGLFSTRQVRFASFGVGLTDAEMNSLHTIVAAYLAGL